MPKQFTVQCMNGTVNCIYQLSECIYQKISVIPEWVHCFTLIICDAAAYQ